MSTRYKVSLDGNHVGYVVLGANKKVLRDDGSVINGDKHTCADEKNPKKDEELHLKHFGDENNVELKGHAKYEKDNSRFLHKEPKSKDDKTETIGRDDWEAIDAGGNPPLDEKVLNDSKPYRVQTKGNSQATIILADELADEQNDSSSKCVYYEKNGGRGDLIETAWHTCKNPRKPEFLDKLSAEGLVSIGGKSFKGPAHFIPQDIATGGAGFFYRKNSEESPGDFAQDDWEALDVGGGPLLPPTS